MQLEFLLHSGQFLIHCLGIVKGYLINHVFHIVNHQKVFFNHNILNRIDDDCAAAVCQNH